MKYVRLCTVCGWKPAQVTVVPSTQRLDIITSAEGQSYRRNRKPLKKSKEVNNLCFLRIPKMLLVEVTHSHPVMDNENHQEQQTPGFVVAGPYQQLNRHY